MKIKVMTVLTAGFLLLTACVKDKDPDKSDGNLIGRWNVKQVKGLIIENGVPKGSEIIDDAPTGFIRFDSDGKGEQNYSYTLLGTVYPNTGAFFWTANETEIRIKQFGNDLIWVRKLNEPNKQQATYRVPISITTSVDYTLTLEK
jgi:hypothetical protein